MPETVSIPLEVGQTLVDCASAVLESMFFASVFGEVDEAAFVWEPMIAAQISFAGPFHGSLAVAATPLMARTLTADFLALDLQDAAPDERTIEDTIGELANMICGSTLSHLDHEGLFTLGSPCAGPDAVESAISGPGIRRLLDIGEGALIVCLIFDPA
jgi:CheY-specific phosphatase CheX